MSTYIGWNWTSHRSISDTVTFSMPTIHLSLCPKGGENEHQRFSLIWGWKKALNSAPEQHFENGERLAWSTNARRKYIDWYPEWSKTRIAFCSVGRFSEAWISQCWFHLTLHNKNTKNEQSNIKHLLRLQQNSQKFKGCIDIFVLPPRWRTPVTFAGCSCALALKTRAFSVLLGAFHA